MANDSLSRTTKDPKRPAVDASFSAYLDKNLGGIVSGSMGASFDPAAILKLTGALKLSLNSKVSASLGTTGGVSGGGLGGSAGKGTSASAGTGFGAALAGGSGGRIDGVVTGELSLGTGMGTRATLGLGSGGGQEVLKGGINFGKSKDGNKNLGVGAFAGIVVKKPSFDPSSMFKIKASVRASFRNSLEGAGYSESEIFEYEKDFSKDINDAIESSFEQAFGPQVPYPNARGVTLINAEITMKTRGSWVAWAEIDDPPAKSKVTADGYKETEDTSIVGPFVFSIKNVEYVGTAVPDRSSTYAGSKKVKVVGGSGGLTKELEPRNYAGGLTKAKTVIDDILRDCGETLSDESDKAVLNERLASWTRVRGEAKACLDLLCDRLGATWRVLRDGKVWVGKDEWPDIEPAGTILDKSGHEGVTKIDLDYPTLVPGVIVENKKVEQVTYTVSSQGVEAECFEKSGSTLFDNITKKSNVINEYSRRYRCKVVTQNSDGTVDIITDDERMKGRGIGKCRVRVGIPGTVLEVPEGARCLIGWDDGDPSLPYVDSWESGTSFESIEVGTDARPAAREGEIVQGFFPPVLPINGTITPGPGAPSAAFVGVITIGKPFTAIIQTGSPAFRVGNKI